MWTGLMWMTLAMAGGDTCEKFVEAGEPTAVLRTGGKGAEGALPVMFKLQHDGQGAQVSLRMVGRNNDNAMLRPGSVVRLTRADGKTIEMTTTELASPEYLAAFTEPAFVVTGKLDRSAVAFLADSTLASVEVPGRLLYTPMDRWKTPERVQMVAVCYLEVAPKPAPAPKPAAPATDDSDETTPSDDAAATY